MMKEVDAEERDTNKAKEKTIHAAQGGGGQEQISVLMDHVKRHSGQAQGRSETNGDAAGETVGVSHTIHSENVDALNEKEIVGVNDPPSTVSLHTSVDVAATVKQHATILSEKQRISNPYQLVDVVSKEKMVMDWDEESTSTEGSQMRHDTTAAVEQPETALKQRRNHHLVDVVSKEKMVMDWDDQSASSPQGPLMSHDAVVQHESVRVLAEKQSSAHRRNQKVVAASKEKLLMMISQDEYHATTPPRSQLDRVAMKKRVSGKTSALANHPANQDVHFLAHASTTKMGSLEHREVQSPLLLYPSSSIFPNATEPGFIRVPGVDPEQRGAARIQSVDDDEKTSKHSNIIGVGVPDTWWRRNKWWLVGAAVIVVIGIVLASVLTTVDFKGSDTLEQTTMAPTSFAEGIEAKTAKLIVSVLPETVKQLTDKWTPQYQGLQWVVKQQLENEGSIFAESFVLQLYSLATLFLSTNGGGGTVRNWRQSDGWLNSTTPCDWYGVECITAGDSVQGDVILGLNLTDNGLRGMFVPELSILGQSLRFLDLSDNDLSGRLPEELGQMSLLMHLSLRGNKLSGAIPSSLSGVPKLRSLDLSSNDLTSTIPSELSLLKELVELRLGDNDLAGEVPDALGSLTNLVHLDVSENRLSFQLPTQLGQLRRLKSLSAGKNSLLGPLPTEMGLLSSLETLALSENFIFKSIPSEIGDLANLKSLDLSDNIFTGFIPSAIFSLRELSSLQLRGNYLDSEIPNGLHHLVKVEILDLSSNFLSGIVPSRVWSLPKLLHFNISYNSFTSDDGGEAWGSDSLEELDFSHNSFSGPGGWNPTIGLALNLKRLHLSNNQLTSTVPAELGTLTKLVTLDLSDNDLGGSVPSELWALTELRSLNLANNILEGTSVFPGVLSLSNLKELRLSHFLSPGSIPSQIGFLTSLESFWLDDTGVSGMLPSEVGLLVALRDFNVSMNVLSGKIPSEVGHMTKLTSFEVGLNNFTGTVPSEIYLLSQLQRLGVGSNQLSGAIPPEMGGLSRLTSLRMYSNGFAGTIPSIIGRMTNLQYLELSTNVLSGFIPTGLGLLTELVSLQLDSNTLTGELPSEIARAKNLNILLVGDNSALGGTIPSELGLLRSLLALDLADSQLTSSLPSEIGHMLQLTTLSVARNRLSGPLPAEIGKLKLLTSIIASDNLLTGSLPSEIGQLELLRELYLDGNPLGGSIPAALHRLPNLLSFIISDTAITGSITEGMCSRLLESNEAGSAFGSRGDNGSEYYEVNCDNVVCGCCGCPPPAPSMAPSATVIPSSKPSTSGEPSTTDEPTIIPSSSLEPSVSFMPSRMEASCSPFSSIASTGTRLAISGQDNGVEVVNLFFSFLWRGEIAETRVTVTTNGVVFLGSNTLENGCCDPEPIATGGQYGFPRIAVAQNDFGPGGAIFAAQIDKTLIISWEGVVPLADAPQAALDFQVLLFENGNVELRWGEGSPALGQFAAGLEDDSAGVVAPATFPPFNGVHGAGVSSRWPRNQCRVFAASNNGTYTEASDFGVDLSFLGR